MAPFYYLGTRRRTTLNFTRRPFYNKGESSQHLQNAGWVGTKEGLYVLDRVITSCLCRESNTEFSMPSPIHLTNRTSRLQMCYIYCLYFIHCKFLLTKFAPLLALCPWPVPHVPYPCCMTDTLLFNNRRTSTSTSTLLSSVIWKVRGRIKHYLAQMIVVF